MLSQSRNSRSMFTSHSDKRHGACTCYPYKSEHICETEEHHTNTNRWLCERDPVWIRHYPPYSFHASPVHNLTNSQHQANTGLPESTSNIRQNFSISTFKSIKPYRLSIRMAPIPKLSHEAAIDLGIGLSSLLLGIATVIIAYLTFQQGHSRTPRRSQQATRATSYHPLHRFDHQENQ